MHIPRFWARAAVDDQGQPIEGDAGYHGIGWSLISQTDADQHALERARLVQQRVMQWRSGDTTDLNAAEMYYGTRPVREPVVDRFEHAGQEHALITRNTYGALILNTAQAMFIDIDLPPAPKTGFITKLFGKKHPQTDPLQDTLDRIRSVVDREAGMGVRLYRTPNGLRGLVTHQPYEPASQDAERVLKAFGADPLYIALCKVQLCFRARLTPKPWRIGMDNPPRNFPFTHPAKQAAFYRWLETYDKRIVGYAACEPAEPVTLGYPDPHPDIAPLVTLHDELACSPGKPLA